MPLPGDRYVLRPGRYVPLHPWIRRVPIGRRVPMKADLVFVFPHSVLQKEGDEKWTFQYNSAPISEASEEL